MSKNAIYESWHSRKPYFIGILIMSKNIKGMQHASYSYQTMAHQRYSMNFRENMLTENMLIEVLLLPTRYSEYKYLLGESNSKI